MTGRSGARVERMGTTIVETSAGAASTGASVTGGGCWDALHAARMASALMTESRMRAIRFLERGDLFGRELDLQRAERLLQLLHLRRADDRRRHRGLVQDPR